MRSGGHAAACSYDFNVLILVYFELEYHSLSGNQINHIAAGMFSLPPHCLNSSLQQTRKRQRKSMVEQITVLCITDPYITCHIVMY